MLAKAFGGSNPPCSVMDDEQLVELYKTALRDGDLELADKVREHEA